jgi:quinol monooxygenase YgiN
MDKLILTFECNVGMGSELLKILKSALPTTRAQAGCISVVAYTDSSSPDRIILLQEWDNKEFQVEYMKWRTDTGQQGVLGNILARPIIECWLNLEAA